MSGGNMLLLLVLALFWVAVAVILMFGAHEGGHALAALRNKFVPSLWFYPDEQTRLEYPIWTKRFLKRRRFPARLQSLFPAVYYYRTMDDKVARRRSYNWTIEADRALKLARGGPLLNLIVFGIGALTAPLWTPGAFRHSYG